MSRTTAAVELDAIASGDAGIGERCDDSRCSRHQVDAGQQLSESLRALSAQDLRRDREPQLRNEEAVFGLMGQAERLLSKVGGQHSAVADNDLGIDLPQNRLGVDQ